MKKIILGIIFIALMVWVVRGFAQSNGVNCTTNGSGDQTCVGQGYSYTIPSQSTLNAEAAAQAAIVPPFNVNTFVQQLAQTGLIKDVAILPYYAVMKDLCAFNNWQALANLMGGLLQGGVLNQTEVDTLDTTLENQQINLDSFNSEVNVSY